MLSREFIMLVIVSTIIMGIVSSAAYTMFARTQYNTNVATIRETLHSAFDTLREIPTGSYVVIDLPKPAVIEFRNTVDASGDPFLYVKTGDVMIEVPLVQLADTNGTVLYGSHIFIRKVSYDNSTGIITIRVSRSSYAGFEQEYISGADVLNPDIRPYSAEIIIEPDGNEYINQVLSVKIPYLEGMRDDFGDLLFLTQDGALIDFYIREYIPGEFAVVDMKIPVISASNTTILEMRYGNDSVKYYGDPDAVYKYFSDFDAVDEVSYESKIGDFNVAYDVVAYSNVLNFNRTEPYAGMDNYGAVFFTTLTGNHITITSFRKANESTYAGVVFADPLMTRIVEIGVENHRLYYTYMYRTGFTYTTTRYYYTFSVYDPDYIELMVDTRNENGNDQIIIDINGIVLTINSSDVDGNMLNFNAPYMVGVFTTSAGAKFDRVIVMKEYPALSITVVS